MTRRRLLAPLGLAGAMALGAGAFTGHAATLEVSSAKLDALSADQAAPTSTVPAGDTTPPALATLEMLDVDTDGRVDRLVATFDEALAPSTATAPWTLANVPSGGTLASVSTSGTVATLTLTEGSGPHDTAVGAFTVALAKSTTSIRDAAGNQSSFGSTAPIDKAGPVPFSLSISNGSGMAGRPDKGDIVQVVWSEALQASSLCGGGVFSESQERTATGNAGQANITITDHVAGSTEADLLTASFSCGLRFGTVSLGSPGYVSANRTFGGNPAADRSAATWHPADLTFTLQLGAGGATNPAGSVTATYSPDPGITDLAGNGAVGTASSTGTHF